MIDSWFILWRSKREEVEKKLFKLDANKIELKTIRLYWRKKVSSFHDIEFLALLDLQYEGNKFSKRLESSSQKFLSILAENFVRLENLFIILLSVVQTLFRGTQYSVNFFWKRNEHATHGFGHERCAMAKQSMGSTDLNRNFFEYPDKF